MKELSVSLDLSGDYSKDITKARELYNAGIQAVEIGLNVKNNTVKNEKGEIRRMTPEEYAKESEKIISSIPSMSQAILDSGMKVNSYHLPFGGPAMKITSSNEEERETAINIVCRCIEASKQFNPSYYVIHGGFFSDLLRLPTSEELQKATSEQLAVLSSILESRNESVENSIKSIAEIAERTGVQICVENLHSANLGCTPQEHVYIIDKINSINQGKEDVLPVGAVLDIGHCSNGVKPEDEIRALGSRLMGLHSSDRHIEMDKDYCSTLQELLTIQKDSEGNFFYAKDLSEVDVKSRLFASMKVGQIRDEHLLPGQGTIDYGAVSEALKEINYQGRFNAEVSNDETKASVETIGNFGKELNESLTSVYGPLLNEDKEKTDDTQIQEETSEDEKSGSNEDLDPAIRDRKLFEEMEKGDPFKNLSEQHVQQVVSVFGSQEDGGLME